MKWIKHFKIGGFSYHTILKGRYHVIGLCGLYRRIVLMHVSDSSFDKKGEFPKENRWKIIKIRSKGFPPCGLRLITKHWMLEYWF